MKDNITLKTDAFLRVPNLEAATNAIRTLELRAKNDALHIGVILANVDRDELYKEGSYKSAREYAKSVFGYKDTYISNLLRYGKDWCDSDGVPMLPDGEAWNAGQIERMLPVGIEAAKSMIEDGLITSDMTAKEVGAVVSEHAEEYRSSDNGDSTKSTRAKVVRQYDGVIIDGNGKTVESFTGLILDDIREKLGGEEFASRKVNDRAILVCILEDGSMLRAEYVAHVKDSTKKKTESKPADNSPAAMWERMEKTMRERGDSEEAIASFKAMFMAANS